MYKMFANCKNLVYVNGISKINRIINADKIFYNCIIYHLYLILKIGK